MVKAYVKCLSCGDEVSFLTGRGIGVKEIRCCDFLYKSQGSGTVVNAEHSFHQYSCENYNIPYILKMSGLDMDRLMTDYKITKENTTLEMVIELN